MKRLLCLLVPCVALLGASPAEEPPPVKVFILAGQSNMEGHGFVMAEARHNGGKGSLAHLAEHEPTAAKFRPLRTPEGPWRSRDDVWIHFLERGGPLKAGFGAGVERIGPELGFGWVIGDALDAPVLLIKCAWGGKSLAVDFRPPGAGAIPYELGKDAREKIAGDPRLVGKYYRETLALVKSSLSRVEEAFPASKGRYELVGFGWHQGWNDRINEQFNAEYESNMAHFIHDMRKDLDAPGLPFVIAETGMMGPEESHPRALSLMKAQAAVAERPEWKGTVAFVGTRAFWRPKEESPNAQGYHWNCNAETYYLIGEAMGVAMKKLLSIQ